MRRARRVKTTVLKCSECGNETTIMRRMSKLKKPGHKKNLWCYRCLNVTVHVELPEFTKRQEVFGDDQAPQQGAYHRTAHQVYDQEIKNSYTVDAKAPSCNCPYFAKRGSRCKHILAVHMAFGGVFEPDTFTLQRGYTT